MDIKTALKLELIEKMSRDLSKKENQRFIEFCESSSYYNDHTDIIEFSATIDELFCDICGCNFIVFPDGSCEECCSHDCDETFFTTEHGDYYIEYVCKKCGFYDVQQNHKMYE